MTKLASLLADPKFARSVELLSAMHHAEPDQLVVSYLLELLIELKISPSEVVCAAVLPAAVLDISRSLPTSLHAGTCPRTMNAFLSFGNFVAERMLQQDVD